MTERFMLRAVGSVAICAALGLWMGCGPEMTSPSPPASATSQSASGLNALLDFTDAARTDPKDLENRISQEPDQVDQAMRVLETDLAEHPENAGGHLLLGEWFHAKKNYRGAIQHLEAAARVDSELSDPHYNLGDVNYELALLDMVMRERYTQHPNGFLLFAPDEPAKQIFRKAIDEYNAAKSLKKSFREPGPEGATVAYSNPDRARERLRQASIYVSDARQESMLMWDQMHAAEWLMKLSDRFPERKLTQQAQGIGTFGAKITNEGRSPVPHAIPLVPATPPVSETTKWQELAHEGLMRTINLASREDQEQLRAAASLAINMFGWAYTSALGREDGMPGDLHEQTKKTASAAAQTILSDTKVLGIVLDPIATEILKKGVADTEQTQYVSAQIDRHFNRLGSQSAVTNVFVITFTHQSLLGGLKTLPPQLWPGMWPQLRQWKDLKRYAKMQKLPNARIAALDKIEADLLTAAKRNDAKAIDKALGRCNSWCSALIQHCLNTLKAGQ